MQDQKAERAFYNELFSKNPDNEHITSGYDELHRLAFLAPPAGLVVDLGCGTGAHALRMAKRGYAVVAVDITVPGVRAARDRLTRDGQRALFFVGDAECLPLRDGAVAVSWTSLLLHHFPRLDKLPRELARITRERVIAFEPNAQNVLTWLAFNVVNPVYHIPAMTANQRALWPGRLTRLFARHGFRRETLEYVDRGWSDSMSGLRRLYATVTGWLPVRFRANKFLIAFARRST